MSLLLAFAPFIGFAAIGATIGATWGLLAGALIAAAMLVHGARRSRGRLKVLEVGTFLLFGGLALIAAIGGAAWSIAGVRLCVDLGLLIIVLVSIAIRRPFTLQYAREETPPDLWQRPEFIRANYLITAVWAAAFLVMTLADVVMVYLPGVPHYVGIVATLVAIVAAVRFTLWYPRRARARVSAPS